MREGGKEGFGDALLYDCTMIQIVFVKIKEKVLFKNTYIYITSNVNT